MPRKIFKRFLPTPESIRNRKSLQWLGTWLHDPNIWHLTRYSVSKAFFIGLFLAFMPIPSQMAVAALVAVLARANLAISVALVWITNPITMPPVFYLAYRVGCTVLAVPHGHFQFELSWDWLSSGLLAIWQPFLLGCLIMGLFFGLLGATLIRIIWRLHVIHQWQARRKRMQATKAKPRS